jgi:TonB family protein
MIPNSVKPRAWPRRRWWIVVAFVFVVQLGLIFGLSDKKVIQPRRAGSVPALQLMRGAAAGLLSLSDPTLFALPHRQGFSGLAWLNIPRPPTNSFDWLQEPRWLRLSVEGLGAVFDGSGGTDNLISPISPARPEPALTVTEVSPLSAVPAKSRLRLEDGLAGRQLITPIELPPEQHTDLLTDSVVQIVVDSEGRPISVPVLLSSSGSPTADQDALRLTRTARFNSVIRSGPGEVTDPMANLAWGRMIFQWQTLPVSATNAPPANP